LDNGLGVGNGLAPNFGVFLNGLGRIFDALRQDSDFPFKFQCRGKIKRAFCCFFPGLVGFADGFEKLKREYVWSEPVREREDGGESVVVSLRRPAPEADTELKIWMSDVDYLPRKAVLLSGTLQVTTVLTELQKNPEFKRGLFSFQRPPDAEMIEMP